MVQHWKCCVRQRTAGSNPVLSAKTRKSRILCGIFCVLAERTELKRFLVVRVSAEPTYAEAHTLAWETALSCPFLNENILGTSLPPHSMRDFLCFGGEDSDEGVPCGSRVGGKPTYAEAHTLAWETALSCPFLNENILGTSLPPHSMRDFLCFGGEDSDEGVPCGSRVGGKPTYAEAHTLAWETALSCPFLNENILGTSLPPHSMRDFLCFGGEDSDEGVPCGSRVGGKPTYAEAHTLAWETALSCPFLNENILGTSLPPHSMRDFLCFGGEDSDEGVPCGSRVGGKPTYAEAHTLAWETALSCPILSKHTYLHSMRDFLCFGGEDRAEEVPCGSRARGLLAARRNTPRERAQTKNEA